MLWGSLAATRPPSRCGPAGTGGFTPGLGILESESPDLGVRDAESASNRTKAAVS